MVLYGFTAAVANVGLVLVPPPGSPAGLCPHHAGCGVFGSAVANDQRSGNTSCSSICPCSSRVLAGGATTPQKDEHGRHAVTNAVVSVIHHISEHLAHAP